MPKRDFGHERDNSESVHFALFKDTVLLGEGHLKINYGEIYEN